MTVSRTASRLVGCLGLIVALTMAGSGCGTDEGAMEERTGPSVKEGGSTTETTAAIVGPLDNFECGRLDEDKVADILGEIEQTGTTTGQSTVNDTSFEDAGCEYFLAGDVGDYSITAVTSDDVDDIFGFLVDHAEEDQFDDNFKRIDDLGDDAFVATATGVVDNLDLFVKVGATTLQISSDLDRLAPADLEEVEENLRELAELALEGLE